jgi:IS5 family transposase
VAATGGESKQEVDWHVAMKPGKRRALGKTRLDRLYQKIERLKAQVRARGEHAFRVVKRQFGYVKVRYRGLAKNTAQLADAVCLGKHMDDAP